MKTELDVLMDEIEKNWPFTSEEYTGMSSLDEKRKRIFMLDHINKHILKASASIAKVTERADHGDELDAASLREAAQKMFVNVLRLARVLEMNGHDLYTGKK